MAKPTYEDLRRTSAALYEYDELERRIERLRAEGDHGEEMSELLRQIPKHHRRIERAFLIEAGEAELRHLQSAPHWLTRIQERVLAAGFLCPKCDDYHFRAEDCCKCHGEGWTDDDVDTECGPVATYAECGCQTCALEAP